MTPLKKFPKYLIEIEHTVMFDLPDHPLWVARLRDPFALGHVQLTEREIICNLWPAVTDGNPRSLRRKLVSQFFYEWDIYWSDLGDDIEPVQREMPEPPRYLQMVQPDTEREFVLEPHTPRLWRVFTDRRGDTQEIRWWQGFGDAAPPTIDDHHSAIEFLETYEIEN